jgi:membrane protease YdiL (CAAX protease family)
MYGPSSILGYAYLAFLLLIFPYLVARGDRSGWAVAAPRIALYISSSVTLWLLVGGVAAVLAFEGASLVLLGFSANHWSWLLLVAVTLVGIGLGIGILCRALQRQSGKPLTPTVRHGIPITAAEMAVFCLVLAPSAGIAEEILFRGFAITRLQHLTHSSWIAVVLTSTAFALAHVYQGWIGPLKTGLGGLAFGAGFVLTGSLLPSMFAHTTLNALSAVLFRPSEPPRSGRLP